MIFMLTSILLISMLGTIAHYLYDFDKNKFVGLFCTTKESIWEHIKMALTPTLLLSFVDFFIYSNNANYYLAKFSSILVIIVFMPILYYGYKLITRKDYFILDILVFYVIIIASQLTFYEVLRIAPIHVIYRYLSCLAIFAILSFYIIQLFISPKNRLFNESIKRNKDNKKNIIKIESTKK